MTLNKAIDCAKRRVLESGRSNRYAFVCREREEYGPGWTYRVYGNAEYQETGNEENCVAAIWSYKDGKYDEKNVFHENGKLAAAIERYD